MSHSAQGILILSWFISLQDEDGGKKKKGKKGKKEKKDKKDKKDKKGKKGKGKGKGGDEVRRITVSTTATVRREGNGYCREVAIRDG